jgi:phage FluMu gp28-like protein
VLACGRRWGKTRLASALITERALMGGHCWVIVPVYAAGQPMFDDLRRLAAQIPGCEIIRGDRLIRYPGGGVAQVKTAEEPALLRGVALDLAVFDEAAHMARLEEIWLEVIRPALADRKGKALFCSTPNGQNYFWQLFQYGQDDTQAEWASWQLPTTSNPFIEEREIEGARRQMTERTFAQEFLAEFNTDARVFRGVKEQATAKPQIAPLLKHQYVAGVDWGRTDDYTVICVLDITTKTLAHLDRFRDVPFELQLNRVQAVLETWRPLTTIVERNSIGQPLLEQLQRRKLPGRITGFTTTNQSKADLVDSLALALERQEITLLDHPVLVAELLSYQAETLPSGLIRYGAPAGGHDDCVMALLLTWASIAQRQQHRRPRSREY